LSSCIDGRLISGKNNLEKHPSIKDLFFLVKM